jgi:outer membrane protein TolC
MAKTLLLFFLFAGIISSYAQTKDHSLDSLINQALQVSPKLKMLKEKYNASESRIEINSNLTDPMLSVGLMNLPTNSFSFSQEPMTGLIAGLSQAFPFPGKLGSVADVAEKDAEIVTKEIADSRNEISKIISQNYWELVFVRKAIDVAYESKRLLKDIAEVVRANYSVSKASQQNLLKVELEITNITDRIEEMKSKENSLISMINAQLLRDAQSYVHTNDLSSFEYLRITQAKLDSLARSYRPFLEGIQLAKQKAVLMEDLARYDYYPNFNLSVAYTYRDEIAATNTPLNDFLSFAIGISLPLNYGGKVSSKVEEAEAMQNMYEQQYQASLQMLNGTFGASVAKLSTLQERIKLIEEAQLPQAEQTFAASLSSYQVAQIDFINVVDAQNKLFQVETNLYRLKSEYLNEINELEFLTGTEF